MLLSELVPHSSSAACDTYFTTIYPTGSFKVRPGKTRFTRCMMSESRHLFRPVTRKPISSVCVLVFITLPISTCYECPVSGYMDALHYLTVHLKYFSNFARSFAFHLCTSGRFLEDFRSDDWYLAADGLCVQNKRSMRGLAIEQHGCTKFWHGFHVLKDYML